MKRVLFISLIGMFIIGGASASAVVKVDCPRCSDSAVDCDECRQMVMCSRCDPKMVLPSIVLGSPGCPECGGSGIIVKNTGFFVNYFEVECGCRGENSECPICQGKGSYPGRTTGICEACQGEWGKPCPHCGGKGVLKANEKVLKVLGFR